MKSFFAKSVPNTSPGISATEELERLTIGLANVEAIMRMASRSKYYNKISFSRLQEMATHGLITHPEEPTYLTCAHHLRKNCYIKWSGPEHLLAHFDAKHKANFTPSMAAQEDTTEEPSPPPCHDSCAYTVRTGVWAESTQPSVPMAMPKANGGAGVWAESTQPSVPMPKANEGVSEETLLAKAEAEAVAALPDWMHKLVAVSDGASISASNGNFCFQRKVPKPQIPNQSYPTKVPLTSSSMWQWLRHYAQFQHCAQVLIGCAKLNSELIAAGKDGPDLGRHFSQCQTVLKVLVLRAPAYSLQYFYTQQGACWSDIVDSFTEYYQTCCVDAELRLRGEIVTFTILLGAMCNIVKQVLNWKLGHDEVHESMLAMVAFNKECQVLGAKAISYLSKDDPAQAMISLNGASPSDKYTGKSRPSQNQLATGELASLKRRSTEIGPREAKKQKR